MSDAHDRPPDPPPDPPPGPSEGRADPRPFLVALVLFVVFAAAAVLFLRPDDSGDLVRTDRIRRIDDTTLLLEPRIDGADGCTLVTRAQVDLDEEAVRVELVVDRADGICDDQPIDLAVTVSLPEPIGDRRVLAGVGRTRLPCSGADGRFECRPEGGS